MSRSVVVRQYGPGHSAPQMSNVKLMFNSNVKILKHLTEFESNFFRGLRPLQLATRLLLSRGSSGRALSVFHSFSLTPFPATLSPVALRPHARWPGSALDSV